MASVKCRFEHVIQSVSVVCYCIVTAVVAFLNLSRVPHKTAFGDTSSVYFPSLKSV